MFEELQEVPSYCTTLPVSPLTALLTATQKLDETQEIEVRGLASMLDNELQDVPSYVIAFPELSTATQNDGEAQETQVSPTMTAGLVAVSTLDGELQDVPS